MALSVNRLGKGVKVQDTIPQTVAVRLQVSTLTPDSVLARLAQPLARTAAQIYRTLHAVAVKTLQAKDQPLEVAQVVFHQPVELLALHLGISRVTFYKHLADLKRLGLLDSRGHVSQYGQLTRKDGTLFAVTLKPGHRARLRYDDLKHQWRDLRADVESGTRTAWAFMRKLDELNSQVRPEKARVELQNLIAWALIPGITENPLVNDCKGEAQEYVYSLDLLTDTHKQHRGEAIDRYAHALAAGYGDSTNLNFWRWLLWRCLEAEHRGLGSFYQLQNALTRLRADVQEWAGLKKPGALLVYRLKQAGIWDALTCP